MKTWDAKITHAWNNGAEPTEHLLKVQLPGADMGFSGYRTGDRLIHTLFNLRIIEIKQNLIYPNKFVIAPTGEKALSNQKDNYTN